jgi:hypothetical protein
MIALSPTISVGGPRFEAIGVVESEDEKSVERGREPRQSTIPCDSGSAFRAEYSKWFAATFCNVFALRMGLSNEWLLDS